MKTVPFDLDCQKQKTATLSTGNIFENIQSKIREDKSLTDPKAVANQK